MHSWQPPADSVAKHKVTRAIRAGISNLTYPLRATFACGRWDSRPSAPLSIERCTALTVTLRSGSSSWGRKKEIVAGLSAEEAEKWRGAKERQSLPVESRRGAVAWAYTATPRFPSPLIEPDVPISSIRLSGWLHANAIGGRPNNPGAGGRRPAPRRPLHG